MALPSINGWTAMVVVAGIAGVCLMVFLKCDLQLLGAYSAAFIGLAGALSKLFPGTPAISVVETTPKKEDAS